MRKVLWGILWCMAGLLGVLLLAICALYLPWTQEKIRQELNNRLSSKELTINIGSFDLSFPLQVTVGDFVMIQNADTTAQARLVKADLALWPLLMGRAQLDEATLMHGRYVLGAPDSAMYMTLCADSILLRDASIAFANMHIKVKDGIIDRGRVDMVLNPDTTPPTPPSPPQKMKIEIEGMTLSRFQYTMKMMPTIEKLSAAIPNARLCHGVIDLQKQTIDLDAFTGSGLDGRYIFPTAESAAEYSNLPTPPSLPDSLKSAPWTINIKNISFDKSKALYALSGAEPTPGLDLNYIQFDSLSLDIKNFYNQQSNVRLPINISGLERSGVSLSVGGTLDLNALALNFKDLHLTSPQGTDVFANALMGMGDMTGDPTLPVMLHLDGAFAPKDMARLFPAFSPYFAAIPAADDIRVKARLNGSTGKLDVDTLDLELNHLVTLHAAGYAKNFMNPDAIEADINIDGRIINGNYIKNKLLAPATAKSFAVPPMTLRGNIGMYRTEIDADLTARTGAGRLALDGRWNSDGEVYDATVKAEEFPLQAFMPLLGAKDLTASAVLSGKGYDVFSRNTHINAQAKVDKVNFDGVNYRDISADVNLYDGQADLKLNSADPASDLSLKAHGNLAGKIYIWDADLDARYIDLFANKLTLAPASLEGRIKMNAIIGPGNNRMDVRFGMNDVFFRQSTGTISITGVKGLFVANDTSVHANVVNRDLTIDFFSPLKLNALVSQLTKASDVAMHQLKDFDLRADSLAFALPKFRLNIDGGASNFVNDILAHSKMGMRAFSLSAVSDSSFVMKTNIRRLDTGSMVLDSIFGTARQTGPRLRLDLAMMNKPGNLDDFHLVKVAAAAERNSLTLRLQQKNLEDKIGYKLGLTAHLMREDSTAIIRLDPSDPIIGYQQWTVNDSNFIAYTFPSGHIDANLRMSGANSTLDLYTEESQQHDRHGHHQEDLVVHLGNIHLSDWIAVNPFAPPIKGDVSADMRLNRGEGMLMGMGSASIVNLSYGKQRVADFASNFNVAASASGAIRAYADLQVNGQKAITVQGALNDSTATSPLDLDFNVIRFPLATANPFIPNGMGKLSGILNGKLKVTGTETKPIFNGVIDFDSTAVRVALTGTSYRFSEAPVMVTDNKVDFNDFAVFGTNDKPLTVNGSVDISSLENMKMNLALKASNMQIVNTTRPSKGADVYGKAFVDVDARVRGSMKFMMVNADLSINSGTNVTYVIPNATNAIANRTMDNMVKFVNFTDTLAVLKADSISSPEMAMMLDANLNIQPGSIINVDLSADGKNKVQLQSNGSLSYEQTPLDNGRLTGRLNIDKGFVRYSPPLLSEKYFTFDNSSYVAFTGEMMNPTLNIHATDVLKANVTQEGQNSRLVNFNVMLGVTGTLNNMTAAFDLSTTDDITVANELETMNAEQRANQAMNLLLYNVYTGPGTKGNAALTGNPLFGFLESQINTWAADNIKGIDLSFGINQYDRTVDGNTSSTMSYSYQVSKSLFNDRFKIVVGGNYSTDASTDENFSQNLINDISFEYFLNDMRTMYLRLFRHTGYESILEGEITQTGVGFVYRRKLRRVGDLFIPHSKLEKR